MRKKYFTEEERKAAIREKGKRWREKNPEYHSKWYQRHKKEHSEYTKEWRENNKEKVKEYNKKAGKRYEEKNPEKRKQQKKDASKRFYYTPKGRAKNLLNSYSREDEKNNRGKCTLTSDWIIEHIFFQPCAHCGRTDWLKIGCNRLDNSLPHTPDNVEPCCWECNRKLGDKEKSKKILQYTLDGEFVREWESQIEAATELNIRQGNISSCCKEKRKTAGGYIWKYKEEVA